MTFEPSKYQEAIYREVQRGLPGKPYNSQDNGDDIHNLVCAAVAGSGKTTTAVGCAQYMQEPGIFTAFGRRNAEILEEKLTGTQMNAINFHRIGYRALARQLNTRIEVNENKYRILAREWANKSDKIERSAKFNFAMAVENLIGKAMVNLLEPTPENFWELSTRYGLMAPELAIQTAPLIYQQGIENANQQGNINFDEMIYLVWFFDLPLLRYAWVIVDEAQDLNAAQHDMVNRLVAPGGRIIAVGDHRQAVYGFAGAETDSLQLMIKRFSMKSMPLSICYRCPTMHLDLARLIVPEIENADDAPTGIVEYLPASKIEYQPGDLVICRLTAPLITACIDLIKRDIPARVEGRSLGGQLNKIIDKVAERKSYTFENIIEHLSQYRTEQITFLSQRNAPDSAILAMADRVDCVIACVEGWDVEDIKDLKRRIRKLFDAKQPTVRFSTVHRAKGLEERRVYILQPHTLPFRHPNMRPWQFAQEINLLYVALTRAMESLVIILDDDTPSEKVFLARLQELAMPTENDDGVNPLQLQAPDGTLHDLPLFAPPPETQITPTQDEQVQTANTAPENANKDTLRRPGQDVDVKQLVAALMNLVESVDYGGKPWREEFPDLFESANQLLSETSQDGEDELS